MAADDFIPAVSIDEPGGVEAFVRRARSSAAGKDRVVKIVIGPSPGSRDEAWDGADLSAIDWSNLFPNLTHLHLWSIAGLTALLGLPRGLKCLDLRGCTGLTKLPKLPASIETLFTDGCTSLASVAGSSSRLPQLVDLSMARCTKLPSSMANNFIEGSPNLRRIDFSGSPVERMLKRWPPGIEVAKFTDCSALEQLPAGPWPEKLRRLELAGTAITSIQPLSTTLDYVNLANMRLGLGATPLWPSDSSAAAPRPRTLLLYHSGLLLPPTFAQGADHEDNVAPTVRGYFEDVRIVGAGKSSRCKVLFLGNGNAGKTTLSRALAGDTPRHDLGTTHGIRFATTSHGDTTWHFWDFGGQAIYHNAHRLFMQSGAVFLVLWNPHEPQPPAATTDGYSDTPRPLPYWIEMIRMTCPGAKIAVVGNIYPASPAAAAAATGKGISTQAADEIRCAYAAAVAGVEQPPELLLCDAENAAMVNAAVRPWLERTIDEVVSVQGTAVPVHWELAEAMVSKWLTKAQEAEATGEPDPRPTLTVEEFQKELRAAITATLADDTSGRWANLRAAWNQGAFLTLPRVERVLGFLTDSGMVFWNKEHLGERVIVGQTWALEGVYAVLERRTDTPERRRVFERLSNDPTFTLDDLAGLVWDDRGYDPDQQRLLLDFMKQMGVCFQLRSDAEAWSGKARYVSVQHLRRDDESRLSGGFHGEWDAHHPAHESRKIPTLHQTRWDAALSWLGKTYGGDARYARDAFHLERNNDGQAILVTCRIGPSGIGGMIDVWVGAEGDAAEKNDETCKEMLESVVTECDPASTTKQRRENDVAKSGGPTDRVRRVFISYSWNPPRGEDERFFTANDVIPPEYEQPVLDLCSELKTLLGSGTLLLDREHIGPGSRISDFITRVKEGQLFVVCHSKRYWRRPYCMYELLKAVDACGREEGMSYEKNFVFVGFDDCLCLEHSKVRDEHVEVWTLNPPEVSLAFEEGLGMREEELVQRTRLLLKHDLGKMTNVEGNVVPRNLKLRDRRVVAGQRSSLKKTAEWIRDRLEMATKRA